ncbi:MAG TPA: DUF3016 domain-containing protein, partial [Rhodanobacteraceae bacterium]|nr:DUF3016 domain-containing protein [Rhodanobacteraceae bacterium]
MKSIADDSHLSSATHKNGAHHGHPETFAGRTLLLAATLAIAGPAVGKSSDDADSRVQVTWTNPQDFSDAKQSPGSSIHRPTPEEWLTDLAKHLRYRADRALPPGDRLQV